MSPRKQRPLVQDTVLLTGWLFADLLLALFVIFMAANTSSIKASQIIPPTPTATSMPTPSPTALPTLELQPVRLTLTVDAQGLRQSTQEAINGLKQQIRTQNQLQGRRAGLVIAYGGAPDSSQIPAAKETAAKVYGALEQLGGEGFVFNGTSYYQEELYRLGDDANEVVIDIFLFKL